LPVGTRKTELSVELPRLECKDCGTIKQVSLPFADEKKHYTRSLERLVIELCKFTTIKFVAELTGLSWDTVKRIHQLYLKRKYKWIDIKDLKYIAIDELYLGKKHKFITIVLNLLTGEVVYIGKGKGKDALKGFWKRIKRMDVKIEAVATDMASGYISAVLEHLPEADLVLDHFHLTKWFNDKLSKLRRDIYKEAGKIDKDVLKGSRWLLIKAPENLKSHNDRNKDERYRLQRALEINEPLAKAYYMKERLRLLFQCQDISKAQDELNYWIGEAQGSGIKILVDAAKMLLIWKTFILNWYKHPISTAKLEATNAKIRTLQKKAYGYRDQEYFHLRIFNQHNETYALCG
jgi:transposase